jgi:transposase
MAFYGIEAFIDLPAFHVINPVIRPQQLDIPLERRERTSVCPHCAPCCSRVKESRTRGIRALPLLERPVMLWLPLRRFECRACPPRPWETRETFGERVKGTERLYHQVREDCVRGCPSRALPRRYGLSARTVCRWTFERSRGGRPRKLGRVIGLEEYARRQGHRDNTWIVAVEKGQPSATSQGRRAEDVIAWFPSRSQDERDQGAGVVLDRSKPYFAAIQAVFGDRLHVIDRFHVVQQAVEALDEVVRSGQKQRDPDEAKALKTLRKRWLKAADQLNVDELIARDEWRRRFPQWRDTLAWGQDVRKWFDRTYDKPARAALLKLMERAGQSAQEPWQRMAGTLSRGFAPIVRYMRHRYTNGMTEGCNKKIKLIQRMAYGLRNEHQRRKRILAWCGQPESVASMMAKSLVIRQSSIDG